MQQTPQLQQAIALTETLSLEEQSALIAIIEQRIQQGQPTLVQEVRIAEREYEEGQARRGSVADLMAELDR